MTRIIYPPVCLLLLTFSLRVNMDVKIQLNERRYEDGLWAFRERCK